MQTPSTTVILLVDDDALLVKSLTFLLRQDGYEVRSSATAVEAIESVRAAPPDLVILDIGLPDLTGVEACRRIRASWTGPIIMLTGRRQETDKVIGLDAGADDYLVKPVGSNELLARVRAGIRRWHMSPTNADASGTITVGQIEIDTSARIVSVGGRRLQLSAREYDLLLLLAERAGQAVNRQFIIDRIWGVDFVGDLGALDVYIRLLRKKLEPDPEHPRYIRTLRGVGYRLDDGNGDP
jgi:DNA-binding response OmpR family regulator